jgi:serine O-acetyltransferase
MRTFASPVSRICFNLMSTRAIDASARIGAGTVLGQFCVIGARVVLGEGCQVGHHVVIHDGTVIGGHVRIDDHAVIGKQPMRAANSAVTQEAQQPPARIGDRCLIGTGAVLYAGCVLGEKVLVADLATLREQVTVGEGTIIGRGVAVENQCRIGRYCKLETNAYVCAYSVLEDRAFLAPGVLTSNDNFLGRTAERFKHFRGVTVRRGGRVGVGAVVLPGKEVGPDAVVAAGALLTHDAEAGLVHTGLPARPLRPVPSEQLLDQQGWPE